MIKEAENIVYLIAQLAVAGRAAAEYEINAECDLACNEGKLVAYQTILKEINDHLEDGIGIEHLLLERRFREAYSLDHVGTHKLVIYEGRITVVTEGKNEK